MASEINSEYIQGIYNMMQKDYRSRRTVEETLYDVSRELQSIKDNKDNKIIPITPFNNKIRQVENDINEAGELIKQVKNITEKYKSETGISEKANGLMIDYAMEYDNYSKDIADIEKQIENAENDDAKRAFEERKSKIEAIHREKAIRWREEIEASEELTDIEKERILKEADKVDVYDSEYNKIIDIRNKLKEIAKVSEENTKQLAKYQKELETLSRRIEKYSIAIFNPIKDAYNMWAKVEGVSKAHSKTLGLNAQQAVSYQKALTTTAKDLALNFGLTFEQTAKIQESFANITDRAAILSKTNFENIAAISKLTGEEATFASLENIDKLGGSASVATKALTSAFGKASSMGLNASKASSVFAKNMLMANRYSFRNGVEGISKMTMLSQKLKFNLESMGSVIDKFSTIEGAIETSANLQMMGGEAAMLFGNPMEAMHDALMNPEALVEKMTNAFAKRATFNTKTGMSELNGYNLQWVRNTAKAMGMNEDEAVQVAKQQAKINEIDKSLSREAKGNEKLKTLIESKAEWNDETKRFEVVYIDDKGESKSVAVSDIGKDQELIKQLNDQTDYEKTITQDVKKIASKLTSVEEKITGAKEAFNLAKSEVFEKTFGNNLRSAFFDSDSTLNKILNGILDFATAGNWKTLATMIGLDIVSSLGGFTRLFSKSVARTLFHPKKLAKATIEKFTRPKTKIETILSKEKTLEKFGVKKVKDLPKGTRFTTDKGNIMKVGENGKTKIIGKTTTSINPKNANAKSSKSSKLAQRQQSKSITDKVPSKAKPVKVNKFTSGLAKSRNFLKGGAIWGAVFGLVDGVLRFNDALNESKERLGEFDEKLKTASVDGNGTKEIMEHFSETERSKAEERIKHEVNYNGDRTNAIGAGIGTAIGSTLGGVIGSFFPGFGTTVGAIVGGIVGERIGSAVSAHDNRTIDDISQEEYETAKLGVSAINVNSDKLKENAAIATIKMHDIMISMWNHMNGKQSNGAVDEKQQSWLTRGWNKMWSWIGDDYDYDRQSKTHYMQVNTDNTPHANEGDVGDSNTTLSIPEKHPLAKAYVSENNTSNNAKVLVANTNETVVSKDKITNLGNAFNDLAQSTNAYGDVNTESNNNSVSLTNNKSQKNNIISKMGDSLFANKTKISSAHNAVTNFGNNILSNNADNESTAYSVIDTKSVNINNSGETTFNNTATEEKLKNEFRKIYENSVNPTNIETNISKFKGDNVSTLTVNDFDREIPLVRVESQPVVGSQVNTVNPVSSTQGNSNYTQQQYNNQPMNMNVNFSGEIKLQGTNSQPIDVQKWCRDNPIEFTKLTRLIMQNMIAQQSGGQRRGQNLI